MTLEEMTRELEEELRTNFLGRPLTEETFHAVQRTVTSAVLRMRNAGHEVPDLIARVDPDDPTRIYLEKALPNGELHRDWREDPEVVEKIAAHLEMLAAKIRSHEYVLENVTEHRDYARLFEGFSNKPEMVPTGIQRLEIAYSLPEAVAIFRRALAGGLVD